MASPGMGEGEGPSANLAYNNNIMDSSPSVSGQFQSTSRFRSYSATSDYGTERSNWNPTNRSRLEALHNNVVEAKEGEDFGKTPTKELQSSFGSDRRNGNSSRNSIASSRRKIDLPELERVGVSHLRHQNSSATIRSKISNSDEPDLSSNPTGPGALRKERRKKSALLEQELSRMRSESRLGSRQASYSPESERYPIDGADTSGTEGSGPVIGNRRRKKSSTSSASKKATAAARAAQIHSLETDTLPLQSSSSSDRFSGNRTSRGSGRRGSDGHQIDPASTLGKDSTTAMRRAAIPTNFRSGSMSNTNTSSLPPKPRGSTMGQKDQQEWPKSRGLDEGRAPLLRNSSPHSTYRNRRFASDADVADLPYRTHRTSIGASGESRHSGRDTSDARANSGLDKAGDDILQSPSEAARQRKISTSSSYSLRSSGGASDLQRSASRASMRRAHGRDVFDDIPPLPESSNHPHSSRFTSLDQREKFDRVQALRERQDNNYTHENRAGSSIEELRSRIDELTGMSTGPRVQSRTSSRASRARSNISSTPSTSVATTSATSVRPVTEPRKPNVYLDRAQIELSPESRRNGSAFRQNQAPSRLGVQHYNENVPHTPETSFTTFPRSANSRMSGRYSSAGFHQNSGAKSSTRPSAEKQGQGLLHARNLQSCIDNLERRILGPNANEPSVIDSAPEVVQMITHLREACSSSVEINNGLRALIQAVLGLQIDAELGSAVESASAAFSQIERGMSSVLRWSDDQMRNLTDGFMSLASLHELLPQSNSFESVDRSNDSIRLNTRSTQTVSPKKQNRLQDDRLHRRSSLDMRRFNTPTIRSTPWTNRRGTISQIGLNNTEIIRRSPTFEVETVSPSTKDSDRRSLSDRSLRRFTASALPSGNASPLSSASPFSHSGSATSKQSSSRIRQSATPVGEGVLGPSRFNRTRSQGEESGGMSHSRSFSEIPQPLERNRENSIPASLSPQKPRPSLARVTTVNVSTVSSSDDPSSKALEYVEPKSASSILSENRWEEGFSESPENSKNRRARPSRGENMTSFEDADEEASLQTASADTVVARTSLSSNSRKSIANGGLGLGLDNVTSRIARSLGRNAGRRTSQDVSKSPRPRLDLDQFTRNDVD